MNVQDMARRAYGPASAAHAATPRSTEYRLFAEVTHRLRAAAVPGEAGFAGLARALHENRRMWRTLALDAATEGNGLPPELRARILYLAEFTRQHSQKVLSGSAGPEVLVEVNTAVMRGLGRTGPA
jgi:flagellar protein FlaF